MGFAKGATYREQTKLLENGEYTAKIVSVEECVLGGWHALKVYFEVDGKKDFRPNEYTLFDPVEATDEKKRAASERKLSRFCDAVGCILTDEGLDIQSFVGKNVCIVIQTSAKGFKEITSVKNLQQDIPY